MGRYSATTSPWRSAASFQLDSGVSPQTNRRSLPTQLNRCAILLTPKQPFIDWANGVDSEGPRFEDTFQDEGEPVFLGPDVNTIDETRAFVVENFDYFFDFYLEMWYVDETKWPQGRTVEMFQHWFDVRIHSIVENVVDAPLNEE